MSPAIVGNSTKELPKLKAELPCDTKKPTTGLIPKGNEISNPMLITALFAIARYNISQWGTNKNIKRVGF